MKQRKQSFVQVGNIDESAYFRTIIEAAKQQTDLPSFAERRAVAKMNYGDSDLQDEIEFAFEEVSQKEKEMK